MIGKESVYFCRYIFYIALVIIIPQDYCFSLELEKYVFVIYSYLSTKALKLKFGVEDHIQFYFFSKVKYR